MRIDYTVTGRGERTVVLLPAWQITNRTIWAAQVAALSRRYRVITFDARGSGGSDRPADPRAYAVPELLADALGVLDATGTGRAVLVGNSLGGLLAYLLAARHPDRVDGLVFIGATVDLTGGPPSPMQRAMATFEERLDETEGWARYNRHAWASDFKGFVEWFVATALGDEATPEQIAQGVAAGLDTTPEILATLVGRPPLPSVRIDAPVLVVHGERDAICPPRWGRALAQATGGRFVGLPGAGHCPHVTRAAEVAELVAAFAGEVRR